MDNRAIGVFDSGLGGLTAVKELKKVMPRESILYFGDTGRVPYGTKSRETIIGYTRQITNFLLQNNVKMIVAACGSVSSTAKEVLEGLPVPCITVIEPTADFALQSTLNGKVGIIATPATIKSGSFEKVIGDKARVYPMACPLFVPLVESGFIEPGDEVTALVAKRYLTPLINEGVDTLILGCTHYPIIKSVIGSVMGDGVRLIDSGRETARHCAHVLKELDLLTEVETPRYDYFVSDSTEGFTQVAKIFLGGSVDGAVKRIDIEKY